MSKWNFKYLSVWCKSIFKGNIVGGILSDIVQRHFNCRSDIPIDNISQLLTNAHFIGRICKLIIISC